MDDAEGRCLMKVDLSLNRIVFRRKLEALLDLRVLVVLARGSPCIGSLELPSSSRPCPKEDVA